MSGRFASRNYELRIIVRRELADLYDDLHGFLHGLYADEFVRSMEVDAAGKDVGAGQTTERQLGTISATTDGLHLGCYAHSLHGM